MNNSDTEISINDLHHYWIKKPVIVIHCGAHLAEELEEYERAGWEEVVWIEANPNLISGLAERVKGHPKSKVVNAALWSTSGKRLSLKVANNSYSSSILDFGTHAKTYPNITFESEIEVHTQTLDSLLLDREDIQEALLVLDLQGAELEALKGAQNSLSKFDFIYTEVSESNLYQDQGNWKAISEFLKTFGMTLVDWQYSTDLNWGNALYQKQPGFIQSRRIRKRRKSEHEHRLTAI